MTLSDRQSTTVTTRGPGKLKTLFGTGVGNALEWFDWNIYALFATYLAAQFFDGTDKVSAMLSALAVFAVGFVARPLGGFVFGWIADRRGRRAAMTLSVAGAAGGSLVIGISPTYGQIGVAASLILLLARLVQGLAHGGEMPTAQTYIAEVAPAAKRGLWSSLIYVSGTAGVMAGTAMGAVLGIALDEPAMAEWGWRIPFVLGGIFGLYALVMRRRMAETEQYEEETRNSRTMDGDAKPSMVRAILAHRKQALQVVGTTVGVTVAYYAWGISAPQYAISSKGVDETGAMWASLAANLVFVCVLPLWGKVSDRVGRKPVLVISAIGLIAAVFPLNAMLTDDPLSLFATMTIALVLIAAPAAIVPAVFAELFPTHIRTAGVGVPYSIAVAVFGGTAPYLQTWLSAGPGRGWFDGYLAVMLLVSVTVAFTLPETRGKELSSTTR